MHRLSPAAASRARWVAVVTACVGAFATASALLVAVPASEAAGFHKYSIGKEWTFNNYTGLSVDRPDRGVTNQASTGCSSHYSGNPLYQTQWVIVSSSVTNWLELGTAHQCNDNKRYRFWGYGSGGNWYPLGQ
ncbi:hypothetical protein GCM10027020_24460 [Nocardioides salsibiostraticola]